ncbi:MAG: hypothetical protein ACT4OF_11335 [Caulobacteraceae bacterium]
MRRFFIVLLALLAACQAAPPAPAGAPLTGSWGGEHIGLELSAAGGRLDYDCAAGTIDQPVRPDASGRFTARGTHTPNTGGPERIDVPRPRVEATYTGGVNGDRLTLSVRTPDAELGPFTLARGAEPMLMRCL